MSMDIGVVLIGMALGAAIKLAIDLTTTKTAILKCPACKSENTIQALYMGLPFKLCEDCETGWGFGAWVGLWWFDGNLWVYRDMSYWRALWNWLLGREVSP